MRASFGEVAVVISPEPTEVEMDHVTAGWGAGVGMGFARGAGAVVVWPTQVLLATPSGGGGDGGIVIVIAVAAVMAVAAAAAVVWTPVSMVGGAVTAIPVDEAHAAQSALLEIAHDPANPSRVADVVAEAARRWRGRDLADPATADTVVEVRLVAIRHGRTWNWWTFNRPFPVGVEAHTTVTRRADGEVLWEDTRTAGGLELEHSVVEGPLTSMVKDRYARLVSRKLTYLEWAADGGSPFRQQLHAELAFVGNAFATEIFGPARPPAARQP
jgi:hypothetical protein